MVVPWNGAKAKVQARLTVQRLRALQEKKEAQAKAARREIATLLERGKQATARVKAESIINEDIYIELLELLELHCELIIARFGLLDQNTRDPDARVVESVCSIIYAAPRTELKELNVLRDMLMHKYGRDFSVGVMENRDNCVSARVMSKLQLNMPTNELVDGYLYEIAKGYGISWTPPERENTSKAEGTIEGKSGDTKDSREAPDEIKHGGDTLLPTVKAKVETDVKQPKLPTIPPTEDEPEEKPEEAQKPVDEFEALAKRFEALKKR